MADFLHGFSKFAVIVLSNSSLASLLSNCPLETLLIQVEYYWAVNKNEGITPLATHVKAHLTELSGHFQTTQH